VWGSGTETAAEGPRERPFAVTASLVPPALDTTVSAYRTAGDPLQRQALLFPMLTAADAGLLDILFDVAHAALAWPRMPR
jgi:hypothetical protein